MTSNRSRGEWCHLFDQIFLFDLSASAGWVSSSRKGQNVCLGLNIDGPVPPGFRLFTFQNQSPWCTTSAVSLLPQGLESELITGCPLCTQEKIPITGVYIQWLCISLVFPDRTLGPGLLSYGQQRGLLFSSNVLVCTSVY